jgi:predicted hydrocarbon binding protein
MSIFEELMLARQLSFSKGSIELLGNRVVIFNANLFSEYALRINNSPDAVALLYEAVKSSFRDGFGKSVGEKYKFSFNDYFKWMKDLAEMNGWGLFTWEGLDQETKKGALFVENSPIAKDLVGKVKNPVDHVICGFIAGGASAAFASDIDVIEKECVALGAQRCEFSLLPAKPKE